MNVKKGVYIALTMVLGLLLSFMAHGAIEIWYINRVLGLGVVPQASSLGHNCFLPASLQIVLLLAGLIGGYFLGHWLAPPAGGVKRMVYVERRKGK